MPAPRRLSICLGRRAFRRIHHPTSGCRVSRVQPRWLQAGSGHRGSTCSYNDNPEPGRVLLPPSLHLPHHEVQGLLLRGVWPCLGAGLEAEARETGSGERRLSAGLLALRRPQILSPGLGRLRPSSHAALGPSDKVDPESVLGLVRCEGRRREFLGPFGTGRLLSLASILSQEPASLSGPGPFCSFPARSEITRDLQRAVLQSRAIKV